MLQMPQVPLPVVEHRSPGVYARELHIPAGVTLTGEIHKYSQLNILTKGRMSVLTEDGIVDVTAPFTVVSPPGTKRIAYAHEDCIWVTILGTDLQDTDDIKDHFLAKDEDDYLSFSGQTQLKLL